MAHSMAHRALFSFAGFPDAPRECHLSLPDQVHPSGAASLLKAALADAAVPGELLASFRRHGWDALPIDLPEQVDDAEFHYRINLVGRHPGHLVVVGLRLYPGSIGWQRRCGPMPLDRFISRFLLPPIAAEEPSGEAAAASPQLG